MPVPGLRYFLLVYEPNQCYSKWRESAIYLCVERK
jgi:hypothetical protein